MLDRFPNMPVFEPGWVWLVGAGPGDPGLLTLLAAHALSSADVVIYDALVDEGVLKLASEDIELSIRASVAVNHHPNSVTSHYASLNWQGLASGYCA